MPTDLSQIDAVKLRFTDLGRTISDVSRKNEESIDNLIYGIAEGLEGVFRGLSDDENFNKIREAFTFSDKYANEVAQKVNSIMVILDAGYAETDMLAGSLKDDFDDMSQIIRDQVEAIENMQSSPGGVEEEKSSSFFSVLKAAGQKIGAPISRMASKEVKGVKFYVNQALGKLHLAGGIGAGIIAWSMWSYQERDRKEREAAELRNIIVSMTDGASKDVANSATRHLGNVQEAMQKFIGVNKQEYQTVLQTFASGGSKITEIMGQSSASIKLVSDKILHTALALDKMMEVPAGSSAQMMNQVMSNFGQNIEEAEKTTIRLVMAGKESGIGTQQFIQNVMKSADSLKDYGYGIDEIINFTEVMQERFEGIGVPRHFAGRQIALGMQQMAQGFANMSDSMKVIFGERKGLGRGLEARQAFMEQFKTDASQGNTGKMEEDIRVAMEIAREQYGGDEVSIRRFLESFAGFHGAKQIYELGTMIEDGTLDRGSKEYKEGMKLLEESFKDEQDKMSDIQRNMNKLMKGMEKVGGAVLTLVGNTMSNLIAIFKTGFAFFENLFSGNDSDKMDRIYRNLDQFMTDIGISNEKAVDRLMDGFGDMGNVMVSMGKDALGDAVQNMKRAMDLDLDKEVGLSRPSDMGSAVPMTRVITVPQQSGGSAVAIAPEDYELSSDYAASQTEGAGYWTGAWAGGTIEIINKGVAPDGGIDLAIVGSCPRCGLMYESDGTENLGVVDLASMGFSNKDVEAAARMVESELNGGTKDFSPAKKKEAEMILWTAINRMSGMGGEHFGKGGGKAETLEESITGGYGYGKQGEIGEGKNKGKMRPFATRRNATNTSREFVRSMLGSRRSDPTRGATHFIHDTHGKGYSGKALPHMARSGTMTAAYGRGNDTAMFFSMKKDAPEYTGSSMLLSALKKSYTRVTGPSTKSESVGQDFEDWSTSSEMSVGF